MNTVQCAVCLKTPAEDLTEEELVEQFGWDFSGEYGDRCPDCVAEHTLSSGETPGVDAIAAALGAKKG